MVYSRNLAQGEIFVAQFPRRAFKGNKEAESIADDPSVFLGECILGKTPLATEFQGLKPPTGPSIS